MATFSQAVANHKSAEIQRTENGMKAFATSDSKAVDLFGTIGSARGRDLSGLFLGALADNEDHAIRVLLWARDVREGAGERQTFRSLLQALEKVNPALAGRIMSKIPFLGRWDDLFSYAEVKNRLDALQMYADALLAGDKLAAKWAPRHMAKSKATTDGKKENVRNANDLMEVLEMRPREYRKLLAANTEVVETAMCAKDWNSINFSHVPSQASARYQKAFGKNASEKYGEYLRELQKPQEDRDPKVKINAGAVFPHDVVKSLYTGNELAANAQWEALPNFVGDAKILPVVDVSGSMSSVSLASGLTAMEVALGLGLYLSDRTSSDFKDMFVTFSARPKIEVLKGKLSQKLAQLRRAQWDMNTNLHAVFEELLRVALRNNVSDENMPDVILILSDMQFDACVTHDDRAIEMIRRKYADAGYKAPSVVFWNLSARDGGSPIKQGEGGTALVSGFSPSIMASVLGADPSEFTPMAMMLKTIMRDRYDY